MKIKFFGNYSMINMELEPINRKRFKIEREENEK